MRSSKMLRAMLLDPYATFVWRESFAQNMVDHVDNFTPVALITNGTIGIQPVSPSVPLEEARNSMDLATTLFLCSNCLLVSPSVRAGVAHMRGYCDTHPVLQGVLGPRVFCAMRMVYSLTTPFLLREAKLDPSTTTSDEMDSLGHFFECGLCRGQGRDRFIGTWRDSLTHQERYHFTQHRNFFRPPSTTNKPYRLLGKEELQYRRSLSSAFGHLEDISFGWACKRCEQDGVEVKGMRAFIEDHLELVHSATNINVPGDYCYIGE
ncbi:hypothetical protein VNI00_004487 [Paramarasmius palmivorus]|uniref:Uncharacterized protein n=1 Tax=Paramarasmius palmivorus TaxID=297713 RepID=A0AAW0DI66_9AGAR